MTGPADGGPYPCCLHCRHSKRYEGHHAACDDCAAGLDVEPVLPDGCVGGHSPSLVSCELGADWP